MLWRMQSIPVAQLRALKRQHSPWRWVRQPVRELRGFHWSLLEEMSEMGSGVLLEYEVLHECLFDFLLLFSFWGLDQLYNHRQRH